MNLRAIAQVIAVTPEDAEAEVELRACLSNLIIGLKKNQIATITAERRLKYMAQSFSAGVHYDRGSLLLAHMEAFKVFGEADHYQRPESLSDFLGQRAVTIQANEDGLLGSFWLRRRASAAEIVTGFANGAAMGTVGVSGRPLWFTPYVDEVRNLCEEAKDPHCPRTRRAEIARTIVATLGLVHIRANDEVVAMVTAKSIGELGFDHPETNEQQEPVGPTAIEARSHRRFRPWPVETVDDSYGRTYELDGAIRGKATAGHDYGLPECVRPHLDMKHFVHCIYLGPLTDPSFDNPAEVYLREIAANSPSEVLLDTLAEITSL